jgi:hypothetical protein
MGKIGRLAVRNLVATVSMAALAVAGTAVAGEQKKSDKDAKVARAMAVAEIDFELHRAQLGLVGSSLLSERQSPVPSSEKPAAASSPYRIAAPAEQPAPAAVSDPRR